MDERDEESTGFAFSRRTVLKGSVVAGVATAGCNETSPTPSGTPTETVAESVGEIADRGLERILTELVVGEEGYDRYLRVVVRNTLEKPMSVVTISAEFFGPDAEFLDVQTATIDRLQPGETFDGYVSYWTDDVAAYAVQTDWSRRDGRRQELPGVSVTDSCLAGDHVTGTVTNTNDRAIPRVRVEVRFDTEAGNALERQTTTVTDLPANGEADFSVESDAVYEDSTATIDDYTVTAGAYAGSLLAVR